MSHDLLLRVDWSEACRTYSVNVAIIVYGVRILVSGDLHNLSRWDVVVEEIFASAAFGEFLLELRSDFSTIVFINEPSLFTPTGLRLNQMSFAEGKGAVAM